ncbi:UNVERIFIED_CONTAM: hypothetical protein Sindi_2456900 [Sesamum indicum]
MIGKTQNSSALKSRRSFLVIHICFIASLFIGICELQIRSPNVFDDFIVFIIILSLSIDVTVFVIAASFSTVGHNGLSTIKGINGYASAQHATWCTSSFAGSLFFEINILFFSNKLSANSVLFLVMEFNRNNPFTLLEKNLNGYLTLSISVRQSHNPQALLVEILSSLTADIRGASPETALILLKATISGLYNFIK